VDGPKKGKILNIRAATRNKEIMKRRTRHFNKKIKTKAGKMAKTAQNPTLVPMKDLI
jgi:hypothetical protein